MKKAFNIMFGIMKWSFIVLCIYVGSLFFRVEHLPGTLINELLACKLPGRITIKVAAIEYGFEVGVAIRGLEIHDAEQKGNGGLVASAKLIEVHPLERRVVAEELCYPLLPDSYYAPGNKEKNARVECVFPKIANFRLELIKPNILAVKPERVECDVEVSPSRFMADKIRIDWPDQDIKMKLDGFCYVDIDKQEIYGEVNGSATQKHIRPLLVALDVPVSLPYMDAFTEVPGKVPSWCAWKVNLVNNDFDLYLDLHPTMGKYHAVPMKKADGKIHLHVYTRDTSLNYLQTIGPIVGTGLKDENLEGTVIVNGTNGYNTVTVKANSALPVADLLKIGGFTGDYVGNEVVGQSKCELEFRFPRAMTNNYEVLNGKGHVEIKNGQVMRMKGFKGLIALLADKVPGVAWFTDATQASCDYTIENGVVKTDNALIEGGVFSIKMKGTFDAVNNKLDYVVHVRFSKDESMMSKVLHPLTWPFTKLLLEFRMHGTPDNPEWSYITVVDRVMEAVR